MKLREICDSCAALRNQIVAGNSIADAVKEMSVVQAKNASFWRTAADGVESGRALSTMVAGQWPMSVVSMIEAGENSGRLPDALDQIVEAIEIGEDAEETLSSLYYPFSMVILGLGGAIFFMGFVIPTLMKALTSNSLRRPSLILRFCIWLNQFIMQHWFALTVIAAGLAVAAVFWFASGRAKTDIQGMMLKVPVMKRHIAGIFYAIWAKNLASMTGAGIPIWRAISLSISSLPPALQPSIRRIEYALEKSEPLSTCAVATSASDERSKIPRMIVTAFKISHKTGTPDVEFNRVAPALIKEGKRSLRIFAGVAKPVAMMVTGSLIGVPFASYFAEMFAFAAKVI